MANFEINEEQAALIRELRKLETSDPVHADVYNALFGKLINNDAFLERLANKMIEKSMLCHVLDSVNTQQVLAADVGPKITKITDGLQKSISGLNTDLSMSAVTLIEDIIDSEITGEIYYRVKAGICYIRCRIITPSASARENVLICSGMPKSAIGQSRYCSNGIGTAAIGVVYIDNNSTELKINLSGQAGNGYVSFSYPINQ